MLGLLRDVLAGLLRGAIVALFPRRELRHGLQVEAVYVTPRRLHLLRELFKRLRGDEGLRNLFAWVGDC